MVSNICGAARTGSIEDATEQLVQSDVCPFICLLPFSPLPHLPLSSHLFVQLGSLPSLPLGHSLPPSLLLSASLSVS